MRGTLYRRARSSCLIPGEPRLPAYRQHRYTDETHSGRSHSNRMHATRRTSSYQSGSSTASVRLQIRLHGHLATDGGACISSSTPLLSTPCACTEQLLIYSDRICPGKLLGEASVFILITTLLATFNVAPPPGGLEPEYEKQLVWCVPVVPPKYSMTDSTDISRIPLQRPEAVPVQIDTTLREEG